jgi:hypothetical protein
MEHDALMEDLVNGYRAYAAVADLDLTAAVEAPASTPFCIAPATISFAAYSYFTTGR